MPVSAMPAISWAVRITAVWPDVCSAVASRFLRAAPNSTFLQTGAPMIEWVGRSSSESRAQTGGIVLVPTGAKTPASGRRPPVTAPVKALGALLVERELLTDQQLEAAIARQEKTGRRLGHVVVELGFVTPDAVLATLGLQHNLPTARVNAYTVTPGPSPRCLRRWPGAIMHFRCIRSGRRCSSRSQVLPILERSTICGLRPAAT